MNNNTLSLVKLAQEICNSGKNPDDAVSILLKAAEEQPGFSFLQGSDKQQAINELNRRFSGMAVKPWDNTTHV
jgi:hypothetical protein